MEYKFLSGLQTSQYLETIAVTILMLSIFATQKIVWLSITSAMETCSMGYSCILVKLAQLLRTYVMKIQCLVSISTTAVRTLCLETLATLTSSVFISNYKVFTMLLIMSV